MILPSDIKHLFFETLNGDKDVLEFENWLNTDQRLENILSPEDYLELISLSYTTEAAAYELRNLVERLVDKSEYEKWRLQNLLTKALQGSEKLPQILMSFYNLYCRAYSFLDNLGLGYGLAVEAPYPQGDHWDNLTASQQQKLLASFYPKLNAEIKKFLTD